MEEHSMVFQKRVQKKWIKLNDNENTATVSFSQISIWIIHTHLQI